MEVELGVHHKRVEVRQILRRKALSIGLLRQVILKVLDCVVNKLLSRRGWQFLQTLQKVQFSLFIVLGFRLLAHFGLILAETVVDGGDWRVVDGFRKGQETVGFCRGRGGDGEIDGV